ncbi:MAG: transporter [Chthoniobacteraceae bacterium]|nr:transporter [Chthoniobacteraceae bacterium]
MESYLYPAVTAPRVAVAPRRALIVSRLAVAALFFMNGVLFASWVSRIPAVQTARGLSHGQLGLALLMIAFGALVGMPPAGWLSSRFGSRRVTQVSAAVFFLVLPLLAFKTSAIVFALILFLFGAAHGALDVAMNAQAVAVELRYGRPIMSSFHALFSVGGLAGAAFGAVIANAGIGLLTHFSAVSFLLTAPLALFGCLHLIDTGRTHSHVARRAGFRWPPKALVALGAVTFCVMMGEGAMADWSAVFLRRFAGSSDGVAAAGYAAFSIAMAAGRFSGDWLSSLFGPVTLVRAGGLLAAAGLGLVLIVVEPTAALIGFAAVGAGFATVVPQVFSAAGSTAGISPETGLATVTTIGYTGFLIGPPLIGFAAEIIGLRGALGIVIVMTGVMIVLAPSVRRSPLSFAGV